MMSNTDLLKSLLSEILYYINSTSDSAKVSSKQEYSQAYQFRRSQPPTSLREISRQISYLIHEHVSLHTTQTPRVTYFF